MSERHSGHEQAKHIDVDPGAVAEAQREIEKRHEHREAANESNKERAEVSKAEALELAKASEKQQTALELSRKEKAPDAEHHMPTKKEREAQYKVVMDDARSHMRPTSRAFSRIIHNRAVETASEITGKTVARPNAILSGSIAAFIITLIVYVIARYFGYPLSGSETIIAFAGGWALGMLYDYFRVMITGKKDL